jgi:beta-lactamase class D
MDMDRRRFAGMVLLGTGAAVAGFPRIEGAEAAAPAMHATLVVDGASGRVLHRSGACATPFSPCSTFKIPLGLMGFDAGVLRDAHHPAWDYDPRRHVAWRAEEKQRTDPTSWERDSVVWFSQEITRALGMARFQAYVDRFGYGNRDLRGEPGKGNGLTHAWLGTSLQISPDAQVAFLRRMLAHRLVSARAHALTEAIIPVFEGSGGWRVHGKTGSGWQQDARGREDRGNPLGWFVGWAEKGRRRVIFARAGGGAAMPGNGAFGLAVRKTMLAEIGTLAG